MLPLNSGLQRRLSPQRPASPLQKLLAQHDRRTPLFSSAPSERPSRRHPPPSMRLHSPRSSLPLVPSFPLLDKLPPNNSLATSRSLSHWRTYNSPRHIPSPFPTPTSLGLLPRPSLMAPSPFNLNNSPFLANAPRLCPALQLRLRHLTRPRIRP